MKTLIGKLVDDMIEAARLWSDDVETEGDDESISIKRDGLTLLKGKGAPVHPFQVRYANDGVTHFFELCFYTVNSALNNKLELRYMNGNWMFDGCSFSANEFIRKYCEQAWLER